MKRAPQDLGPEGRKFWKKTLSEYEISAAHDFSKLADAARCRDTIERCVKILEKDGPIFTDKNGLPRRHPAQKVLLECQAMFLRACREIGLDLISDENQRPPRQY